MADAPPPADEPRTLFDRLGAALPVALTALSTVFAGMSTGELSRAMYWRSTAAQDQSKANDQWSLAGFKRDRALVCETTAETLRAVGGYKPVAEPPKTSVPEFVRRVGEWTRGKGDPPAADAGVRAVLVAVHAGDADAEVLPLARKVDPASLNAEIAAGLRNVTEAEKEFDAELAAVKGQATTASAAALRYEVDSRRYRAEATANQWVGFLYEVRVKTSTAASERHRQRSENFFIAMLAAQVGAVGSSLALARKRRNVLWLLAGTAGLVAVGFGGYVYLTM
ncbi:MAG: hypothetical protein ABGY75_11110 [Gemmataceae bacterium]